MDNLLEKIKNKREAILLGEIGAFLHMFGKASSEFLKSQSTDKTDNDKNTHQELKHLPKLEPLLKNDKLKNNFVFTVNGNQESLKTDFTDFITKYSRSEANCNLLRLFSRCHGMTSADEKGTVRRKQPSDKTNISTPFGYDERTINPVEVDNLRIKMDELLASAFDLYVHEKNDIDCLRKQAISILKPGYSKTAGDTRIPANDVTLWDQSYGVACLYKPVLAALALGYNPTKNKLRWRLFGICWNGNKFIERGKKTADILARQEIINNIIEKLRNIIEVEYPIGNRFYSDTNGAFFTFPEAKLDNNGKATKIDDAKAFELVKEFSCKLKNAVSEESENELFPFFTLSKSSRTLMIIKDEIEARDKLLSYPRTSIVVSQNKVTHREDSFLENFSISNDSSDTEVCPVCLFRAKTKKDSCDVCYDRKSHRLDTWINNYNQNKDTIWISEVADKNNQISLLTLKFDLSMWLNGDWFNTILSQIYNESDKLKKILNNNSQQLNKLNKIIPNKTSYDFADITNILKECFEKIKNKKDLIFYISLLNTFFDGVSATEKIDDEYYYEKFIDNIKSNLNDLLNKSKNEINENDIAIYFFTQNPSPGRLYRVWQETERFFDLFLDKIKKSVFINQPQRLKFKIDKLQGNTEEKATYVIGLKGLNPSRLMLIKINDDFLTIDSLKKFSYKNRDKIFKDKEAVKEALKNGKIDLFKYDDPKKKKIDFLNAEIKDIQPDLSYYPVIEFAKSPVFFQVLLPTQHIPQVLKILFNLYDKRFAKVRGKLPLNVGLITAKHKFPLYVLLEAGQKMLEYTGFSELHETKPWWDTISHAADDFYSWYPVKQQDANNKSFKFHLADLKKINDVKKFLLNPGYFDFDFLGSISDRNRIYYDTQKGDDEFPKRESISYGKIRPRPIPLHKMKDIFTIWDLFKVDKISSAQLHQLEQIFMEKIELWQDQEGFDSVFEEFAKAMLKDVFGSEKWNNLHDCHKCLLEKSAVNGMLLDTLQFFLHIIKEDKTDD